MPFLQYCNKQDIPWISLAIQFLTGSLEKLLNEKTEIAVQENYILRYSLKSTNVQEQGYITIQLINWSLRKNGDVISWLWLLQNNEEVMLHTLCT